MTMKITVKNIFTLRAMGTLFFTTFLLTPFFLTGFLTATPASFNFKAATEYSTSHRGDGVLVLQNGKPVFSEFQNGYDADKAHVLHSGTKSFSGIALAALIEDGKISGFDEKVSDTITEWREDALKKTVTYRQLLSLSSGVDAGKSGLQTPTYAESVASPQKYPVGSTFQYGPVPFMVFGEVVKRKLGGENMVSYLKRRIFDPLGMVVGEWENGKDGNPKISQGAHIAAKEWAKFGEFLRLHGQVNGKQILRADLLAELLKPSTANKNYGITFWLGTDPAVDPNYGGSDKSPAMEAYVRRKRQEIEKAGPVKEPVYMAAGAGDQRLYILEKSGLVIVRFGAVSTFSDAAFLNALFD